MMQPLDRFYLIVGHVSLLKRLVPLGVRLVQLRLKGMSPHEIQQQIIQARRVCAAHHTQLVINDFWQAAIDLGCDFVHLGQEDMNTADFDALRRAGVRFGLSTHDEAELERALALSPDYIALGPIYPTRLKKMSWPPQGLDRVCQWKTRVGKTALVGIGGLTPRHLPELFAAGANSAAVVTDIAQADNPEIRCRQWITATRRPVP
ncbi:MAG: thiamine phosphate synthase [Parahaliea sp.]